MANKGTDGSRLRALLVKKIMLKKLIWVVLSLGCLASINACSKSPEFVTWQEDVKLSDGRVIVVTQKKRCEGAYTGGDYAACIAREAWLTINLPEFSPQPIVWHENLFAIAVNVHDGKLYVVGCPPSEREFHLYGSQRPPYFGFIWENGQWKRIPFNEIPEEIYDTNMFLEAIPPSGTTHLTVVKKEGKEMNGDRRTAKEFKRIDPTYMSNFN